MTPGQRPRRDGRGHHNRTALVLVWTMVLGTPPFAPVGAANASDGDRPAPITAPGVDTAAPVLACVSRRITAGGDWSATFHQSQHIAVLSTPLESTGRVDLRAGSIRWEVMTPITQVLTIDAQGRIRSDDGSTLEHPAVASTIRMLLSMDVDGLSGAFGITGQCDAQAWSLDLVPRDQTLSALFSAITLRGSTSLDAVDLQARNGDATRIRFAPATPESPALNTRP